jgi:hypothetical protein
MAFRNPFEIRREKLLDQLLRMRANFEQQLRDSAIPVLEGGRPGQRIRLQHAGQLGGWVGYGTTAVPRLMNCVLVIGD